MPTHRPWCRRGQNAGTHHPWAWSRAVFMFAAPAVLQAGCEQSESQLSSELKHDLSVSQGKRRISKELAALHSVVLRTAQRSAGQQPCPCRGARSAGWDRACPMPVPYIRIRVLYLCPVSVSHVCCPLLTFVSLVSCLKSCGSVHVHIHVSHPVSLVPYPCPNPCPLSHAWCLISPVQYPCLYPYPLPIAVVQLPWPGALTLCSLCCV